MDKYAEYVKVLEVVKSCKTYSHVQTAKKFCELFKYKHNIDASTDIETDFELFRIIQDKETELCSRGRIG